MVCRVFGWWEVGGGGGEVRWFCGDGFEMVVRGCVVFERVVFEGGGGGKVTGGGERLEVQDLKKYKRGDELVC